MYISYNKVTTDSNGETIKKLKLTDYPIKTIYKNKTIELQPGDHFFAFIRFPKLGKSRKIWRIFEKKICSVFKIDNEHKRDLISDNFVSLKTVNNKINQLLQEFVDAVINKEKLIDETKYKELPRLERALKLCKHSIDNSNDHIFLGSDNTIDTNRKKNNKSTDSTYFEAQIILGDLEIYFFHAILILFWLGTYRNLELIDKLKSLDLTWLRKPEIKEYIIFIRDALVASKVLSNNQEDYEMFYKNFIDVSKWNESGAESSRGTYLKNQANSSRSKYRTFNPQGDFSVININNKDYLIKKKALSHFLKYLFSQYAPDEDDAPDEDYTFKGSEPIKLFKRKFNNEIDLKLNDKFSKIFPPKQKNIFKELFIPVRRGIYKINPKYLPPKNK